MSGNRLVLDTCTVIAYFDGQVNLNSLLESSSIPLLPTIVFGELLFGIFNSKRRRENQEKLDQFANQCELISVEINTAREYPKIRFELKKKGKPIPENDIWTAALARQYRATLLTHDSHFSFIENLNIKSPSNT